MMILFIFKVIDGLIDCCLTSSERSVIFLMDFDILFLIFNFDLTCFMTVSSEHFVVFEIENDGRSLRVKRVCLHA